MKSAPVAAATLWAARIWPGSLVARRRRWTASISSPRLALEPNRGCAQATDRKLVPRPHDELLYCDGFAQKHSCSGALFTNNSRGQVPSDRETD